MGQVLEYTIFDAIVQTPKCRQIQKFTPLIKHLKQIDK